MFECVFSFVLYFFVLGMKNAKLFSLLEHSLLEGNTVNSLYGERCDEVKGDKDLYNMMVQVLKNQQETRSEIDQIKKQMDKMNYDVNIDGVTTRNVHRPVKLYANNDQLVDNENKIILTRDSDSYEHEFLMNISHEIRTPMNAIMGISKMLTSRESQFLSDLDKDGLRKIHQSGNRLMSLVNGMIDLALLGLGKMKPNLEPVTLSSFLEVERDRIYEMYPGGGIRITVDQDSNVPGKIITDKYYTSQIITSVVKTVIQITHVRELKLSLSVVNGQLCFDLSGKEIDDYFDEVMYFFDKTSSGSAAICSKYPGTGMALSLSRRYLDLLGGGVAAIDESKGKSFVRFCIPLW